MEKVRIAMIGVGAISGIYLQNITKVFREVDLVGVCDLIPERAQKGAGYVEEQIKEGAAVRQPKIYTSANRFLCPQVQFSEILRLSSCAREDIMVISNSPLLSSVQMFSFSK